MHSSADLRLDDLDEEQDVVRRFGQEGHLPTPVQEGLIRRLQALQQFAPKQRELPKKKFMSLFKKIPGIRMDRNTRNILLAFILPSTVGVSLQELSGQKGGT